MVAIMRSVCAVAAMESRCPVPDASSSVARMERSEIRDRRCVRTRVALRSMRATKPGYSIRDLRLQLSRFLDDLLDGFFRRQDVDQFAPGVDVFHVLRKPRRIAQSEFANGGDAGGAQQNGPGLAHARNPHVVADI